MGIFGKAGGDVLAGSRRMNVKCREEKASVQVAFRQEKE
jgi:hypothetical protein